MVLYLGVLLFSFIITAVAIVPFIDFLYKLKFTALKIWGEKVRTPTGGGVLLIAVITFLFALLYPVLQTIGVYITSSFSVKQELNVIFFTFLAFGLAGLYDDILKTFNFKNKNPFGIKPVHKLVIQFILATIIAVLMFINLNIHIIYVPFVGIVELGWFFIPLAVLTIVGFINAFNVTDQLDGLAGGTLLVALLAFWALSVTALDTLLSVFIALWIGSLIAFLYFNVYPARLWLGNAGGLAFGATLAVVGLLIGKGIAIVVIGGIFVVQLASHILQLIWLKVAKKKLFPQAPIHMWLRQIGWSEPKVVMRTWLAAVMLAFIGLWLAQL